MERIEIIVRVIGYAGVIGGAAVTIWRAILEYHKIQEGIRCQLRSGMLHIYYKNLESKTVRQYDLENFILMYKAYKALKGNSFIDEIYEAVTSWEMIT